MTDLMVCYRNLYKLIEQILRIDKKLFDSIF